MHLTEAVTIFLHHRTDKGCTETTVEHYQRWLRDWLTWRATHCLGQDLADVGIDDFQHFLRYLRQEHRPHQDNPHRPPAERVGLQAESIQAYYRVLKAFWRYCESRDWLSPAQQRYFEDGRIPIPNVTPDIRKRHCRWRCGRWDWCPALCSCCGSEGSVWRWNSALQWLSHGLLTPGW